MTDIVTIEETLNTLFNEKVAEHDNTVFGATVPTFYFGVQYPNDIFAENNFFVQYRTEFMPSRKITLGTQGSLRVENTAMFIATFYAKTNMVDGHLKCKQLANLVYKDMITEPNGLFWAVDGWRVADLGRKNDFYMINLVMNFKFQEVL